MAFHRPSRRRGKARWLLLPILISLWACDSTQVAGTGSQSGNSVVAGRIAPTTASPAVGAVTVFLRPLAWTYGQTVDSRKWRSTLTDPQGYYSFSEVPVDTYRVEAEGAEGGWSRTVRAHGDSTRVTTGNLQAWGHLVLEIEVGESIQGGRVEFYGLDRYMDIPHSSAKEIKLRIDGLPVGLQTVRIYLPSLSKMFCESPVRIGPDSVSTIEYEAWDRSGKGPLEDD